MTADLRFFVLFASRAPSILDSSSVGDMKQVSRDTPIVQGIYSGNIVASIPPPFFFPRTLGSDLLFDFRAPYYPWNVVIVSR